MVNRDGEMVEIGRRLAAGRRIALVGPRMEFADARMQAAGLCSTVSSVRCGGEEMIFFDPSPSVLGFSARLTSARVRRFDLAAVFVANLRQPQIEALSAQLAKMRYRLHPETWAFSRGGMLRWLVVSRVSEPANSGITVAPRHPPRVRAMEDRCVSRSAGPVLVYLGAGPDVEALRTFLP